MICFRKYLPFLILLFYLGLSGCNTNKYLQDDQYLLAKVGVKSDSREIPNREFAEYIRQKPNKKIFGFARFHLWLYNLSNPEKNNWFNKWLRKIGEKPVVYQPELNRLTTEQLQMFLVNKGFHEGQVKDSVYYRNYKAYLDYRIKTGQPIIIRELNWTDSTLIPDHKILQIVSADSTERLVSVGDRFDKDMLRQERVRISNELNNLGYYGFIKEYIYYLADTLSHDHQVDIKLGIQNPVYNELSADTLNHHPRYMIRDIRVIGDFSPRDYMQNPETYFQGSDTVVYKDVEFIFKERLPLRQNLLHSCIYFEKGDLFRQTAVDKTYTAFQGLRNFKTTNIKFIPDNLSVSDTIASLDCQIELSPSVKQRYEVALEGTHSSGNLGVAGNVIYNHRNLFHGAEDFELKFKGAIEFIANSVSDFNRMIEFGVDASLDVPQFWLPLRVERLQQKYSPRTNINISYNYQQRPDFTRTIGNGSFGYNWKNGTRERHQINIIDLNYVNVTNMSDDFAEFIKGKYIESSYRSHVVPSLNYTYTFSNQSLNRDRDFVFIRLRPEAAGNLFSAGYGLSGLDRPEDGYKFFDTPYAQYLLADIDLRYFDHLNESNRLVFRFYAGAGYPYGNASALPFEKKFFSGGSNGIRAWQVRSLGPGSYVLEEDEKSQYPNQLGDIKLEANAEYRFDLFWHLKGAVFLDAGNIWAISSADEREGAVFKPDSFYRDLAVGTGLGVRLDLSFVIIRLDLGAKLRDPGLSSGRSWLPVYDSYFRQGLVLNFAIGYPF
jgi:outer membrane protein assembly factor BamA